jgi:hypothetical protein
MSKERAIELRLAGKSRSQIVAALGLKTGGAALNRWLTGVPAPAWTKRPNAKDDFREIAVELRKEGRSYAEIQAAVPVSKSTLSLWLRGVLVDEAAVSRLADRKRAGRENAAAAIRARREAKEQRIIAEARAQMPPSIADSELFLVGLALYWSEGAKAKPWNPSASVCLVNSDPNVILVFLAWLSLLGVTRSGVTFRVAIHRSGDVDRAEKFWAALVGVSQSDLGRTSLKTHIRRQSRHLPAESYVGCLRVDVRKSTDFNRQIAGWWQGVVAAL